MGQPLKVACDEKCNKAFGSSTRPTVKLSDDPDDFYFLGDDELGDAPEYTGTLEGGEGKPLNKVNIPNKWCVRECERCAWSKPGEYNRPLPLKDWSKRIYNMPYKHQDKINERN